jgi:hypothetical protein
MGGCAANGRREVIGELPREGERCGWVRDGRVDVL